MVHGWSLRQAVDDDRWPLARPALQAAYQIGVEAAVHAAEARGLIPTFSVPGAGRRAEGGAPSGGEAPCDDDDLDTAAIFERELVRAARAWAARRKRILIKAKRRAREVERAMRRAAHKQLRGARLRRWLRLHKQQRRAGNSS